MIRLPAKKSAKTWLNKAVSSGMSIKGVTMNPPVPPAKKFRYMLNMSRAIEDLQQGIKETLRVSGQIGAAESSGA
jgi:hypothetical protein